MRVASSGSQKLPATRKRAQRATRSVVVVVLVLERVRRTQVGAEARRWLGGFLAVSILLNFFVLLAEYITIASARVPGDSAALSQLAFGSYAWIFWSEIGTGIVALALVITPRGRASRSLMAGASALILVNVALERMQLIVGGLRFPNLGYAPGISLGTPSQLNTIGVPTASSFAQVARYTPSWGESGRSSSDYAPYGACCSLLASATSRSPRRKSQLHRPPRHHRRTPLCRRRRRSEC